MTESHDAEPAGILPAHAETWEDVARFWYAEWTRLMGVATTETLERSKTLHAQHEVLEWYRSRESAIRDLMGRLLLEGDYNPYPELADLMGYDMPVPYASIDQEPDV